MKMNEGGVSLIRGETQIEDMQARHVLEKQFVQPLKGTLPDVLNRKIFELGNTEATTITDFKNGAPGQRIYLLGDGFSTVEHGTFIYTSTAANKLLEEDKVYTFTFFKFGLNSHKWVEDADDSGGGGGGGERENPLDEVPGTTFDFTADPDENTTSLPTGAVWFNQGGTTFLNRYRAARLIIPGSGTTNNLRGLLWPVTSASTIRIQAKLNIASRNLNDQICGIAVRETSTGRLLFFGRHNNGSLYIQRWTSVTSWSANSVGPITITHQPQYFEAVRAGTIWTFGSSIDGRGFVPIGSHNAAGWMTTYDEVGFGGYSSPASTPILTLEWLRVFSV